MGGTSILASSWTVYNELAATRPDLIHVLSKPDWPFDTLVGFLPLQDKVIAHTYLVTVETRHIINVLSSITMVERLFSISRAVC